MDIALTSIPQDEALRYLGCGSGADPATRALAEECSRLLLAAVRPKALWRELAIQVEADCVLLPECGLTLPGEDLSRHLAGCSAAVLMAATLGAGGDALIRRWQVEDLARGVTLDCCATAAVEEVCDLAEAEIAASLPGKHLTSRFSPGYGDLPIGLQGELLTLLDAPRRMGLCATRDSILTPRKSVTALLGVSDRPLAGRPAGCRSCSRRNSCSFRRGEGAGCPGAAAETASE